MFQSDCLTLTLQELIHIRSVLTKAEIESLPVEGNFKEDVENRKVIKDLFNFKTIEANCY